MTNESDQADALVERIFGATLGTMDLLAIYLGDRLGYYGALAGEDALTAGELAERVGADERYTREWLEHQAVGGILEVDDAGAGADQRRYRLLPGHAEVLLDRDSLRYLAPLARILTSAATRMPDIVEAYRSGRGVPWGAYGADMREAQGDINRPLFQHELAGQLAGVSTLKARLEADDARVAEVGCGVGWAAVGLATTFPGLRVDGFDPDEPSIELARKNAAERGVADRVTFHAIDAAAAGGDPYDVVLACECIHDLSDPVAVLASMRRLAGESGEVVVIDERVAEAFGAPGDEIERLMYGYSILICLLDGRSRTPSRATGTVMRPGVLRGYAREAGFYDIEVLPIEHDTFRYYRLVT